MVAINRAILSDWPVHAFCAADHPQEFVPVWGEMVRAAQERGCDVWCERQSAGHWRGLVSEERVSGPSLGMVCMALPWKPKPSAQRMSRERYNLSASMFLAVARLIGFGVKQIEIVGADFDGDGDFDPRDGSNQPAKHETRTGWVGRWRVERADLGVLCELAAEHGITITHREGKAATCPS